MDGKKGSIIMKHLVLVGIICLVVSLAGCPYENSTTIAETNIEAITNAPSDTEGTLITPASAPAPPAPTSTATSPVLSNGSNSAQNLKLYMISSDCDYNFDKEKEIRPKLENFVNSGDHEIVKVNTVYSRAGYLIRAEVYYRN